MATGKRGGPGVKDRNIGESAGIRPYKLDLVYASETAFLAAKGLNGENLGTAEEGDWFYDSTTNSIKVYNGSQWEETLIASSLSGDGTVSAAGALTVTDVTVGSDAAGDLLYKSSATALARLPKGNAGDVLTMDSSGSLPEWSGKSKKYVEIQGSHVAPVCSIKAGSAATGADTTLTQCALGYNLPHMVVYNEGSNTTRIAPQTVVDANCTDGLELPSTDTDNVGGTITFGGSLPDLLATTGAPTCFTVGTDPAFFMEVKFGIPDVSDYDVLGFGFVEPAAAYVTGINTAAALAAAYDEKALMIVDAGDIKTMTSLAGSDVTTDLSESDWVDDEVHTFKILVDAAGAVTYEFDGGAASGAAAFSFAASTVVTPAAIFAKGAAVADTPPIIEYIKWGLQ